MDLSHTHIMYLYFVWSVVVIEIMFTSARKLSYLHLFRADCVFSVGILEVLNALGSDIPVLFGFGSAR